MNPGLVRPCSLSTPPPPTLCGRQAWINDCMRGWPRSQRHFCLGKDIQSDCGLIPPVASHSEETLASPASKQISFYGLGSWCHTRKLEEPGREGGGVLVQEGQERLGCNHQGAIKGKSQIEGTPQQSYWPCGSMSFNCLATFPRKLADFSIHKPSHSLTLVSVSV